MLSLILAAFLSIAPDMLPEAAPQHIVWSSTHQNEARLIVLGTNLISGCFKAGFGNIKEFWPNCFKGMIGGSIAFLGQYVALYAYGLKNPYILPTIGKFIQDIGLSMSDNLMRSQGIFDNFQTDIGPVSLQFGKNFAFGLSFVSAVGLGINIGQRRHFDWKMSLYYSTPVFYTENIMRKHVVGSAIGNVITYAKVSVNNGVLSHEYVHSLQFSRYRFFGDIWRISFKETKLGKITEYWSAGQDIAYLLDSSLGVSHKTYYYSPTEIEAYWMEK